MTARQRVLADLAAPILAREGAGATLVAVDGRSAAGKTTLADELAGIVAAAERPVLRSSIDGFHPPGHRERSASGRYTNAEYYDEGYDYHAFRRLLLEPVRQMDRAGCRLALWDSFRDVPFPEEWTSIAPRTVLIVDGAFLSRPELHDYWDFRVWLDIDLETMLRRARARDSGWAGSPDEVERRYRNRWIPLHEHYEQVTRAPATADVVVDNRDPARPCIRWRHATPKAEGQ